jgi:DNA-binding NtrC family response regulator
MPKPRILSLGYDHRLMPLRSMLLRQAGYEVAEIYSWGEALRRSKSEIFNLLLICHTVPLDQREELIATIFSIRPHFPVLCLPVEPAYCKPCDCQASSSTAPEFLIEVSNALQGIHGS